MGDDEDLTTTVEEQLANEDAPDGSETQPMSQADLDAALQEENAETSLDQPSDGSS